LTYQNIVATNLLLFNQAQLPQLFKVVKSDAGAAKMQGSLDFTNTYRAASF
jgi:hypothetical protein